MKFYNKIIIILFCLFIVPIGFFFESSDIRNQSKEQPKRSGSISNMIIRPDDDNTNSGFISSPASGYLFSKIDDAVNYPTASGDSDYIIGDDGDSCELEFSDISLSSNQKVISIKLYARGQKGGTPGDGHYLSIDWRIASGSYSSHKSVQYTSSSFEWKQTSTWSGLELSQNDINNLRLRIRVIGSFIDKYQHVSVLYLELTVETNHDPHININSPNGGEIIQNWTMIDWSYSDIDGDSLSFDVYYAIGFNPWKLIISGLIDQGFYNWTLEQFNETVHNVRIRIEVDDGNGGMNYTESADFFTVRVNLRPKVDISSPNGGEIAINMINLEWESYDNNSDDLLFNLYYKISMGNWISIQSGLMNINSYVWNLSEFTETYAEVKIKINVTDGWGGYGEDTSDDYFTIKYNQIPEINLTYPVGGEILKDKVIISWSYSEPDGDTMRFNISYQINGGEWVLIVQDLVNSSSYEWDLSSFQTRMENVAIKIEGIDEFGGKVEIICQSNFTIAPVSQPLSPFNIFMKFFPFILLGMSLTLVSISAMVYMRKKRKKKDLQKKVSKISNKYIENEKNGTKKVIIEADLLVKRGKKYSENDLLNLLFSDKEVSERENYESVKILGKLNITTLSEDFWEKIEKFKWEDDDKEEFINDMLALPPSCRDQFIDEMLDRFEVN